MCVQYNNGTNQFVQLISINICPFFDYFFGNARKNSVYLDGRARSSSITNIILLLLFSGEKTASVVIDMNSIDCVSIITDDKDYPHPISNVRPNNIEFASIEFHNGKSDSLVGRLIIYVLLTFLHGQLISR